MSDSLTVEGVVLERSGSSFTTQDGNWIIEFADHEDGWVLRGRGAALDRRAPEGFASLVGAVRALISEGYIGGKGYEELAVQTLDPPPKPFVPRHTLEHLIVEFEKAVERLVEQRVEGAGYEELALLTSRHVKDLLRSHAMRHRYERYATGDRQLTGSGEPR